MSSTSPLSNCTSRTVSDPMTSNESNTIDEKVEELSIVSRNSRSRQRTPPSPSRLGHFAKYTKPKIGPMYQCSVPKFVSSWKDEVTLVDREVTGSVSASTTTDNEGLPESDLDGEGAVGSSSSSVSLAGIGCGRHIRCINGRGGRTGGRGMGKTAARGKGKGKAGGAFGITGTAAGQIVNGAVRESISNGELNAITIANAAGEYLQDIYEHRSIPRGGLCVHRPLFDRQRSSGAFNDDVDQLDDFIIYTRNLFLQTPRPCGEMNIDAIWDKEAQRIFGGRWEIEDQELSRKKTTKRKAALIEGSVRESDITRSTISSSSSGISLLDEEDSCKSKHQTRSDDLSRIYGQSELRTASIKFPLCGLEDDEQMLSFLETDNGGDVPRAKLSMIINADRGYGVHRRKAIRKKRKDECESFSNPTTFTSESWRWRLHQARPTMLGDLRAGHNANYQYFDPSTIDSDSLTSTRLPWRYQLFADERKTQGESKIIARARSFSLDWTIEEIEKAKIIWKSILSFTNDILNKMVDSADTKKSEHQNERNISPVNHFKPNLAKLLALVGKAHALPTPEEAFGRRDPSARVMSQNMNAIIDAIEVGRDCAAKLFRSLKDDGEGVELSILQKCMDEIDRTCPVMIPQTEIVMKQLHAALLWEEKLKNNDCCDADTEISDEDILLEKKVSLEKLESLVVEGRNLTICPRSLVRLECRVERAYVLRRKITVWNEARNQENPQNIKFLSSLIKEANKIDLMFPEIFTLTGVHKKAEEWIDRASVAVRSMISFEELKSLVSTGEGLPLNVSDILEKLQSRLRQAQEWIDRVKGIVQDHEDKFLWMKRIRTALNSSNTYGHLVSLVSDGSRIPVDMECMKLLQLEIDARNWCLKARQWIPSRINGSDDKCFKRGKIDDVREHLDKASFLRDRLWFGTDKEKIDWCLEGEDELFQMVTAADSWLGKYHEYISQDNRSKKIRMTISMSKLQTMVEEVNEIPLNLGNPSLKMNRVHLQAEEWMKTHHSLLKRCGISYSPNDGACSSNTVKPVKVNDLNSAISEADADLFFELEEVSKMKELIHKTVLWTQKASTFSLKTKKTLDESSVEEKYSMDEIDAHIDQASKVPLDITEELDGLKKERIKIIAWRHAMHHDIRHIITLFSELYKERARLFSACSDFSNVATAAIPLSISGSEESRTVVDDVEVITSSMHQKSKNDVMSIEHGCADYPEVSSFIKVREKSDLSTLVCNFVNSAKTMNVTTPEGMIADELTNVMTWLDQSYKMLSSTSEAFDQPNFSSLDNLVKSGQYLLKFKVAEEIPEDPKLIDDLRDSWAKSVKDNINMLLDLKDKRTKFLTWCKKAEDIISDSDTKIPIATLKKLVEESALFPSISEVVICVRKKAKDSFAWLTKINKILSQNKKISMEEVKVFIDEAEKLNIVCQELKTLRSALRTTKNWVSKLKKCGAERGESAIVNVNELIQEHNTFLVTALDKVDILKQAMCGYCLCRHPYEGFMIGCDGCEEWYHGPCVGVTEEQAKKFEKYVCLRCSTLRIFRENAASVAGALRKWSTAKGLTKARLLDSQRYCRKVRTCERDLCKAKENLKKYEQSGNVSYSSVCENVKSTLVTETQENMDLSSSDTSNCQDPNQSEWTDNLGNGKEGIKLKKERDLQDKIEKAKAMIDNCEKRIKGYKAELVERKNLESKENSVALYMKRWCRMVKQEVLSPKTKEEAERSRPRGDKHSSGPMEKAKEFAISLGIVDIPDVDMILNSFKVFSWCLQVLGILMRRPKVEEFRALLLFCDGDFFKFPESKCVRMMRSISSRAQLWQSKVKKALMPDSSKTAKPFDLDLLKELLFTGKQIPLTMPEESRVWSTIEDAGCRHCICGGPSDGSFMLGCDNCYKWFHGSCMKIDKAASEMLPKWICPPCIKEGIEASIKVEENCAAANDKHPVLLEMKTFVDDVSPYAPDPTDLWPPFGLRDTNEAIEALGNVGDSDNEDFNEIEQSKTAPTLLKSDDKFLLDEHEKEKQEPLPQSTVQLESSDISLVSFSFPEKEQFQPLLKAFHSKTNMDNNSHSPKIVDAIAPVFTTNDHSNEVVKSTQLALNVEKIIKTEASAAMFLGVQSNVELNKKNFPFTSNQIHIANSFISNSPDVGNADTRTFTLKPMEEEISNDISSTA